MTSGWFTIDLKDDIVAVYQIYMKVTGQEFF